MKSFNSPTDVRLCFRRRTCHLRKVRIRFRLPRPRRRRSWTKHRPPPIRPTRPKCRPWRRAEWRWIHRCQIRLLRHFRRPCWTWAWSGSSSRYRPSYWSNKRRHIPTGAQSKQTKNQFERIRFESADCADVQPPWKLVFFNFGKIEFLWPHRWGRQFWKFPNETIHSLDTHTTSNTHTHTHTHTRHTKQCKRFPPIRWLVWNFND